MISNGIPAKPHYMILDGLRGVAALMVVAFHIFEAHATSRFTQFINHGYLAVDLFFLLSGFVIGYAYDDRWEKLSLKEFFKRRLIRLQPMIIMGMVIGAACFYFFQDSGLWPGISEVPVVKLLAIMLIGFTLIPVLPSPLFDIRGWQEMHPLNGPAWSLFFEYVANILYATVVRKFSNFALSILVVISAAFLVHHTVTSLNGDVIGGWSLAPEQFFIGLTRLMFPFFAGLLLCRITKLTYIPNAFLWCSLAVVAILAFPRIGDADTAWKNGIYESFSIILLFPLIIYVGASGRVNAGWSTKLCKFFGDISYPIYITHYPIIYIYTGWVYDHKPRLQDTWMIAVLVFFSCVVIAYLCLKLYDEPVRKWLNGKFSLKNKRAQTVQAHS